MSAMPSLVMLNLGLTPTYPPTGGNQVTKLTLLDDPKDCLFELKSRGCPSMGSQSQIIEDIYGIKSIISSRMYTNVFLMRHRKVTILADAI